MNNYSTYLQNIQGGIGITAQTGYNTISYTFPNGLNFLCGITGYSGTNSNFNSNWVFNCTQTPATFPVWGFSNDPYFYGYITQSNSGSVSNPTWNWNNLPLGTYKLIANSGGTQLGSTIQIYGYTYSAGTFSGVVYNASNYWTYLSTVCTIINPSGSTPTMNIQLGAAVNPSTNPNLAVYLFKLI
jgi:hypothetical protein